MVGVGAFLEGGCLGWVGGTGGIWRDVWEGRGQVCVGWRCVGGMQVQGSSVFVAMKCVEDAAVASAVLTSVWRQLKCAVCCNDSQVPSRLQEAVLARAL
jgi:hypothetical protein